MIALQRNRVVTISTGVILASGVFTSDAFDVSGVEGFFSLEWVLTGSGTMKAEVLVSNHGVTFHDIEADIIAGQTVGTSMKSFTVSPCKQIKIKFTETSAGDTITVVTYLLAL